MQITITQQQAQRLTVFLKKWLQATMPGLLAVRVTGGVVAVRDALGWRDVGMAVDYLQIARALGKL